VNLINLAASLGDEGTNYTGGGVLTITAGAGSGVLAYVQVPIGPPGAVAAGAAWRLSGATGWSTAATFTEAIASGSSVTLEFKPIPGWDLPTNNTVQVTLGQLTVVQATYTPSTAQMGVTPGGSLVSSGYTDGPFNPPSIVYSLTNLSGSNLSWTVSATANWLSVSPSSGTLAGGATTNVQVSISANANGLAPGNYTDTVGFTNLSNGSGNTSRSASLSVVLPPGNLGVSPAGGLASSGYTGGPFSPPSLSYGLTNAGGSSLNWAASAIANWLSVSPSSGTLAGGASTNVQVSISANANGLAPGNYTDTVGFTNLSSGLGNTSRLASLSVVLPPGNLGVSPTAGLASSGYSGGPFSPASTTYGLTNVGGSNLSWTVSATANWLSVSPSTGTLAGGASTNVQVSISANAIGLAAGNYTDTVGFTNLSSGLGNTTRSASLSVVLPLGNLGVSPTAGLASSGYTGGPFSPPSILYALTNAGGSNLSWTVSAAANWLSVSPSSGTLAGGASTNVQVSISASANGLAAGNYTDTVGFTNLSSGLGNTNRSASLSVVLPPGNLGVSPAAGLASSGYTGGPFSPASISYVLTNAGGSNLSWAVSATANWLSVSPSSGTLAGGASTNVQVSISANANGLAPGNYTDTVGFTNLSDGLGNTTRSASLSVVLPPGNLGVSPAAGLASSGYTGGPFSPASILYGLTNSGGSNLSWAVSATSNWLSVSPSSGTLAGGASTNVQVSINANANGLATGNYTDTVGFTNLSSGLGNTTRSASLSVVLPSGNLGVSPAVGLASSGYTGGPFSPASISYGLTNAGGSNLSWTVSAAATWLTVSPSSGTLAGGASTNVLVSISANANGLATGNYTDTVGFTNLSSGLGNTSRSASLSVVLPSGKLGVSPAAGLASSGYTGGPFSPASISYGLTNAGGSNLSWTVSATANWLSLSPSSGILAGGASTNVQVSLTANANGLAPGNYTDTVGFTNLGSGSGNTTRSASLSVVLPPGNLGVSPAVGLASSGYTGGPFSPPSILYGLTNSGGSNLSWAVSATANWLNLSPSSGTLAGGASTNVQVSISANANGLAAGNYTDTVGFTNLSDGMGNTTRSASLSVVLPPAAPVLTFNPASGLGITGTTGATFRLEYRASLVSGQWLPLKTNTLGPGFNLLLPWPPTNGPAAFYRAVWLP
jgi:hypothetical protein